MKVSFVKVENGLPVIYDSYIDGKLVSVDAWVVMDD